MNRNVKCLHLWRPSTALVYNHGPCKQYKTYIYNLLDNNILIIIIIRVSVIVVKCEYYIIMNNVVQKFNELNVKIVVL